MTVKRGTQLARNATQRVLRLVLPDRVYSRLQAARFGAVPGRYYDAGEYWQIRLETHGMSLRGVGNAGLSEEENRRMYAEARCVFLDLCRSNRVDFLGTRILDTGCGTGFYTEVCRDQGARNYVGVDIVEVNFDKLRAAYPGYRFVRCDVSSEELSGEYDLVIMIDVTQHITDPNKFTYAIQNIRRHIAPEGSLILTSWLNAHVKKSFYEVSRPLEVYKAAFSGWIFGEPRPFRDKWIFSLRKPHSRLPG